MLDRASGRLEVHVTNDLAAGVTGARAGLSACWGCRRAALSRGCMHLPALAGELVVEAIPYAATDESDVVVVAELTATMSAFSSGVAWAGSLAADVLHALSQQLGAPATPAELFLRLQFCPTAVHRVAAYYSPFFPQGAAPAQAAALSTLQLALGSTTPLVSDGSEACPGLGIELPAGAGPDQCAAARRLLRCSQVLVFPTELRDAALAPADVEMSVDALAREVTLGASGGAALFVSVEAQRQAAGRLSDNFVLLLPWQNLTLQWEGGDVEEPNWTVTWLQHAVDAYEDARAAPNTPRAPAANAARGPRRAGAWPTAAALGVAAAVAVVL